jgi:integrase/recombinase XerD
VLTLYRRVKSHDGKWTDQKVKEGRGIRTGDIKGPFFVRPWVNGVQKRTPLKAETFAAARLEADRLEKELAAPTAPIDADRVRLDTTIETYLDQRKHKAPKTLQQYRLALYEFRDATKAKYLHEITVDVVRAHKDYLVSQGFAGKTVDTRLGVLYFMFKKSGVTARIPTDEMPSIETEAAVPYSQGELDAMFRVMTPEEKVPYAFFLGSACRDQEVNFAAWADIDFDRATYTVRAKPDLGFTIKNHESRTVPLPDSLMKLLKDRRKKHPADRWIFQEKEAPGNHFLRKLKQIAKRAGINCGQCKATISKWRRGKKHMINVSCAKGPHCQHILLHRFRKTCATRWIEAGISVRSVQHFLGHKSLETTQLYLGVTDTADLRSKINAAIKV